MGRNRERGGKGRVGKWLRVGLSRPHVEAEVSEEIEHHLAEMVDRLVEDGMEPEAARREAERRFGDVEGHRRALVEMNGRGWMMRKWTEGLERLGAELAYAVRGLRRNPRFALGVLATLGLGIGVNGAMFAVTDRLLLRAPEHVERPDEVKRVVLERRSAATGEMVFVESMAYPDLTDLRTVPDLAGAAGYSGPSERTIGGGAEARRAEVAGASWDFFPTLGVEAALGRFFAPEDDGPTAPPTTILGWDYWQRAHGGDPDVLGAGLEIQGVMHTIIGIAPPGFTGAQLGRVDVWMPLGRYGVLLWGGDDFVESRGFTWMRLVARVANASRLPAVEEQITALHLAGRQEQVEQGRYAEARILATPIVAAQGPLASEESRVAAWLFGVAALVLLIACANVANLLLARGEQRRREQAVRLSLGVSRAGLLRSSLWEAVLLALGGGALALGIAHWGAVLIRDVLMPEVHWVGSAVDARMVAFTVGIAIVAGLVAGTMPAVRSARPDVVGMLQHGGRGHAGRRSRMRAALAVAQVGLSVVLLVGAGLFIRSLHEVRSLDLGLDVDRLVVAYLEPEGGNLVPTIGGAGDEDAQARIRDLYVEAARAAASVEGVAAVSLSPMRFGWSFAEGVRVPGLDSLPRLPGGGPYYIVADEHYFATVGLEIVRGRGFEPADRTEGSEVAVVSETMAEALWPGGDAVGQCIHRGEEPDATCTIVVGVVQDASRGELQEERFMAYYVPLTPEAAPPAALYLRATGDARAVATAVAGPLRSIPGVQYADVETLREALDPQARAWSMGATLFTAFGVLALLVAVVGLYSLLAFEVADRTRELGIRAALGAHKGDLLRRVVLQGTGLALAGVVLGLGVALALAPRVEGLLFGVPARDPLVIASVAAVLLAASALASWVPGLRATGVDPMTALRAE